MKSKIGGDPRIHLIEGTLARGEMNGLLAACDAFVSLHRSEGFGFGLAEAMLLGKPAIGTDYSGNCDFLNPATGFPVPYGSCRCRPANIRTTKARSGPSLTSTSAARHMASIVENPVETRRVALAGQTFIKTHHSLAAVGREMRDRLTALGLLDEKARA